MQLSTANKFYTPTAEHIAKLSGPWCASFSGGKDSTSLVTWIEWLRRAGQVDAPRPQLVQSDTTVEYPALQAISRDMMKLLRGCGWECAVVEPKIHEKLYNRILGVGVTPIHPAIRRMRWPILHVGTFWLHWLPSHSGRTPRTEIINAPPRRLSAK